MVIKKRSMISVGFDGVWPLATSGAQQAVVDMALQRFVVDVLTAADGAQKFVCNRCCRFCGRRCSSGRRRRTGRRGRVVHELLVAALQQFQVGQQFFTLARQVLTRYALHFKVGFVNVQLNEDHTSGMLNGETLYIRTTDLPALAT